MKSDHSEKRFFWKKSLLKKITKVIKNKFNYHDVSINNSKVKARQKESLVPLKVNDIKNKMLEYKNLSGEDLVNKIFDIENREKKVVNTVKRFVPKIKHLEL